MTKRLTTRKIEKAATARVGERHDLYLPSVPGLILRGRTWALVARYPGHQNPTRRALGRLGKVTQAEIEEKARRWWGMILQGVDPASEETRKPRPTIRLTFAEFRSAFLKHFEQKKKHAEATRILTKDFAAWDPRLANDIDAADVDEAIHVILDRGSKYQAINAFGYVRGMYKWGMGQPRLNIKASPCANLSAKTLIGKKRPRTRVLSDDELRDIWNACVDERCIYPYGQITQLLMLCPVRENEIARMSRGELQDLDDSNAALLIVPSARMKGEEDEPPPPHEIPLTPRMISIIKSMPVLDGAHVFSTCGGAKPVNGWSKAKRRLDEISGVTGWIFHDLRRSARTRISAIPAEEHVREALLAHGRRGIQAHYDQHLYRDEKRHLLQEWDDRLQQILNPTPADVTDLDTERARRG